MYRARSVKAFLIAVFLCAFSASAQLVVYENSAKWSGQIYGSIYEFGDEVLLTGTARVLTKLSFEYEGDFIPDGDEKARLFIYSNTGPAWRGDNQYLTPSATPLWASEPFAIEPGSYTVNVTIPRIKVPQRMTWTVQFSGLSMARGITRNGIVTNDLAGLRLFGAASIGTSYNDFWERRPDGWTPVTASADTTLRSDFGALIMAIPEATTPKLTASIFAKKYLLLSWPVTDTTFMLQGKTSFTNQWVDVTAAPTKIGDTFQRVLEFGKFGVFRLREIAPRAAGSLQILSDTNTVRLRWPTNATGFVLQTRSLLTSLPWADLNTPAAASTNGYFEVVQRAAAITQIYRLRESDTAPAP